MCYNTDYRGSQTHARACQQKDALDGPFVACARRRKRGSAGAGDGGEFFSVSRAETRDAREDRRRDKNMPTVVDPRFIFVAGGDLLVNPSMSPPFHTPVPDEDEKGVQR